MTLPAPKPGLVIRYRFFWSHEAEAGAEEGSKDRPCAIVVAAALGETGDITVLVAPITHALPDDDDSIAILPKAARLLGLDGADQWIRVDELNEFVWPGYDLRPIPGRPDAYAYGPLPETLFKSLRAAIRGRVQRQRPQVQKRD